MRDALGNERLADAAALTIEVADVPRPAARAWLADYDSPANILTIEFRQSPDFAAA